jgi:CRISPR system Cascade subunit CasD
VSTLVLRLSGPLQAWGTARFVHRHTRHEPTKSGVLGLLAAAAGRRRTDPIEDLAELRFGVRVDQAPSTLRDFQTARSLDGKRTMPLSYRYYLADAVYLAAVEGDQALVAGLLEALRRPVFPLYLGRRSCPPAGPLRGWLRDGDVRAVLRAEPWQAAASYRRRQPAKVPLEIFRDAAAGDEAAETIRDVPLSFDPERREYGWRDVVHELIHVNNDDSREVTRVETGVVVASGGAAAHDPFAAL